MGRSGRKGVESPSSSFQRDLGRLGSGRWTGVSGKGSVGKVNNGEEETNKLDKGSSNRESV